ncbi:MAG: Lrp/AsnC family transcriptional regulator, leucine-responsive regulatory protein [Blastocatellia bacterium]|nr:Lrp/AsnC family transcriptional regulator, leucine-responsive regulatory protein [Blastocatellia bacterium]
MIDEKDLRILQLLQRDGRTTNVELARAVELTPSATLERVRKLEERGLIKGYMAELEPGALELGLLAFIFMRVDEFNDIVGMAETTAEMLAALPSVLELHHLAGEDCFLVKVRARDTDDLYRILKEEFGQFKAIRSTRTTIVLKTVKETGRLPLNSSASMSNTSASKEGNGK